MTESRGSESTRPDTGIEAVRLACAGGGVGNDRGECIEWRGHTWVLADWRNDGNHVHLTLTAPRRAPYRMSTNDG